MELSFPVCLHLHAQQLTCHRQADLCKHAKTTEAKQKNTLVPSSTTGICNYIQSTRHTLIPFFFHYRAGPLAKNSAGELQIQIHLAALSGCCKLEPSILTLIRVNESHVLSKHPQTGGNIHYSHSVAVFQRTDAMYSIVMTTNYIRRIPYHLWCFLASALRSNAEAAHF